MKFNPDCVRDILIHIESFEYGSSHTIDQMCSELPRYSYEELDYHCLHLYDAGFIKATTVNIRGGYLPQVSRVFDLTYQGHQFLDEIRSDNVWNKTKETAKSIGSFSVNTLSTIATGVITSLAQKGLGLQ